MKSLARAKSKRAVSFLPSVVMHRFRRAFGGKREPIRFIGDFKSWDEADRLSTGYAVPEILQKTRGAILKAKAGEAAFERGSVIFETVQYDFSLLAGLLRTVTASSGRLNVLAFGG